MKHHLGTSSPCSIVEEDGSKFRSNAVSGQTWELVICDVVKAHCYVVDNGWIDLKHTHSRIDINWLPSACYWFCYVCATNPLSCHLCLPCQSIYTVRRKDVCVQWTLLLNCITFHRTCTHFDIFQVFTMMSDLKRSELCSWNVLFCTECLYLMYLVVFTQCIYSNCVQPLYKFLSFCTCRPYCRFMLCICAYIHMCNSYKHKWVYLWSSLVDLLSAQTSRADCFAQPEYEVWRRYKDFEWLREQLSLAYPTHIIPVREGRGKDVAVLLYVFLRGISLQKGLYQELQVLVLVRRAQQYLSISNFSSFTLCTLMCCLFIFFVPII